MLANACCCPKTCLIESDDFNRADNADIGGKWTDSNSRITGNRLTQQALGAASAITTKQHNSEMMVVDVTLAFSASSTSVDVGMVAVNYLDSNNYLYVYVEVTSSTFAGPIRTRLRFFRRSGGTDTQLGATRTIDASNGILNHQLRVCYDGKYLRTMGHVEAATKIDSGFKAGLLMNGSSAVFFDDFKWYKYAPKCPRCVAVNCVSCSTQATESIIVDFGVGGLTDSACTYCDQLAGEFIVTYRPFGQPWACATRFLDDQTPCRWFYESTQQNCLPGQTCGFICLTLLIAPLNGALRWQLHITLCNSTSFATAWEAIYHSASAVTNCSTSPVTMNKAFESWTDGFVTKCTGTLPATIELRTVT